MPARDTNAFRRSLLITIKPRVDDAYPVEAVLQDRPRTIPAVIAGSMRIDDAELRSLVDPTAYGAYLGDALLRGAIRDAFVRAVAGATPLHLLLSIDARELRPLLWERLCGPPGAGFGFLALDQRLGYARYIPSPVDREYRELRRRDLRALVLVACPEGLAAYGLAPFAADAAAAAARDGLAGVPCDVLGPVLGAIGPATLDGLCEALTRNSYAILHVVAHGRARAEPRETLLFLEKPDRSVDVVEKHELVSRLGLLARGLPHFIFFAACESGVESGEDSLGGLGRSIVGELGVPAVLAMSSLVAVDHAAALTRGFYTRLQIHGHVDQALVEASAGLAGASDALVPSLYTRLGNLPLFAVDDDEPTRPGAPEPEWSDVGLRDYSEALQRAYARRERLLAAHQPTELVDGEISGLRLRLRGDGQLHAGDLLAEGRYLLLALAGEGLSSTVWRTHDHKLGREVALKVLHPQLCRRADVVKKFRRAAERMRTLEHPHIVPVLGPPEEDHGRHFFAMALMPGGTLEEALRRRKLAVDNILPIVRALGSALAHAHEHKLLHRDVEPSNVLFDDVGQPRLADFDMALELGKILDTGMSHLGPAIYVAPECVAAHPEARPETDVYGLAMTALFMYNGAAPIEALRAPKRFVGRLPCPPAVRRALLRAGAFEPRDRFPSIAAFLAALDEPETRWSRTRLFALIAIGACLGVGLTTCALLRA
ncbi:MAG: protein kinase [Nannocystis sp.]|uniref:protein kinase domain-containing protein n=1 Tax=Nannocystis sp. TaxID=1962667 RepID=UPI002422DF23|nr:protein kinase [Nannocystis sp.]MBK9756653.1 protein kinase [Nannocystis sp.]